jgi:hypothetical protein
MLFSQTRLTLAAASFVETGPGRLRQNTNPQKIEAYTANLRGILAINAHMLTGLQYGQALRFGRLDQAAC